MEALFDLMVKGAGDISWQGGPYLGYNGSLIPGSQIVSVKGGFGNICYQSCQVPAFTMWQGDYRILEGGIARARSATRSIELNCMMGGCLEQRSAPHPVRYLFPRYINLSHCLFIDSSVKLIRGMHYSTFDLHFTIEALQRIMPVAPDLISTFINEYEANRQMQLFTEDVRPDKDIAGSACEMLMYAQRKDNKAEILEHLGLMLLIKVFLYKQQLNGKKGLDKMQQRILSGLQELRKALLWEISQFSTTKFYAQKYLGTNESDLRKHFKNAFGISAFAYWRTAKIDHALYLLLNTGKPIKEIAFEAGFISPKAFNKEFKKYYNDTPTYYRKSMSTKK